MTPETKREPTAFELRVATRILPSSPGVDGFLLEALRTQLARALELDEAHERAFDALGTGEAESLVEGMGETYRHMAGFNASPEGAVALHLRMRLRVVVPDVLP